MVFDTEDIRKGREDDWFRQNEAAMIEAARKKRELAERAKESSESEERRKAHWRKCPKCGSDMNVETIADIEVEKCSVLRGHLLRPRRARAAPRQARAGAARFLPPPDRVRRDAEGGRLIRPADQIRDFFDVGFPRSATRRK